MNGTKSRGAKGTPSPAGGAERRARLAEALRENLRKRKAQARARAKPSAGSADQESCENDASGQQSTFGAAVAGSHRLAGGSVLP